jgi:putative membrane protein
MKKIFAFYALLALAVFVLNGVITEASNQDSFWNDAAQSGMAEVMLGNLALQKSSNDEVKQFAQKMVDDHTMANNELKDLAATKSVTLPTEVTAKQKSGYDKLSAMSGDQFDKEFMKMMVKDHEKAVSLFQNQADKGTDADVKAFAAKTLPTLQGHLSMAKSINDKMKSMKSNKKSNDMNMNSNSNSNSR